MANFNSQQEFLDKIAGLREQLALNLAPILVQNPQAAEQVTQIIDRQLSAWIASERLAPGPPDGGLAALVGIGPEAASDIGGTYVAPPVAPYDEAISSQRLQAVADLYYFYQHEKLGTFRAVMKLQEQFRAGTVRLSSGKGAFGLYQFNKREVLRYTRNDRFAAYRRLFGYGSGPVPAGAQPNSAFHPLFSGFINQVTLFWRDKRISDTIRTSANDPSYGSIATVRRAGLDLRNNLKWSSYGNLNVMRIELMELLNEAFAVLGSDDIKNLFGADTVWDVIEDTLMRYGNERVQTSPRQRMAETGRNVLQWLGTSHILQSSRSQFEALLTDIAEDAEEWQTSAQAVGAARPVRARLQPLAMPARAAAG